MKVLELDVRVGDGVAVGDCRVFPLIGGEVGGPPT